MPLLHLVAQDGIPDPIAEGVAALRAQLGVPDDFPQPVLDEASRVAAAPVLPDLDRTDIPFVTIDPVGSMDLDQALHIERAGDGYTVHYAIADVGSFVLAGGALDTECHARGETLYAPQARTPLHPPTLSEAAASLLPGQVRPAVLWSIGLDAKGAVTSVACERARVASTARLDYEGVQKDLDAGTASECLQLLREVGKLREQQEIDRGGVSLQVPEQEIVAEGESWHLVFRQTLPVEDWNAQISLLTGFCAAKLMLDHGCGVLRTLPPAQDADVARLRRIARALGLAWPQPMSYPEFVRSLDPSKGPHAAMLNACTRLFRGAGYASFDGTPPEQPLHAALAASYAHCTAPLRRLVDRYSSEIALAHAAGEPVPQWVKDALPKLPEEMAAADARAKKYERGLVALAEALVLQSHIGAPLTGMVVDADDHGGTVQLAEPAASVLVSGTLPLGQPVTLVVESVDLVAGKVKARLA